MSEKSNSCTVALSLPVPPTRVAVSRRRLILSHPLVRPNMGFWSMNSLSVSFLVLFSIFQSWGMFRACANVWAKYVTFLTHSPSSLPCLWPSCASPASECPAISWSSIWTSFTHWDLHALWCCFLLNISLALQRILLYHFPYSQGNHWVFLRKTTTEVTAPPTSYSLTLCH